MSRAISQALNIRVVSMTGGRKAISPPGPHFTVAAATYVPFTRSSSSSSPSAKPRRHTEQEERENRQSHQTADILGLAWDPELEPEFRGPLWESAAASAKNKKSKKKNSGTSGSAEDASTTMEETLTTMKVNSTTSSSSPRSGGDWGLSSGGESTT